MDRGEAPEKVLDADRRRVGKGKEIGPRILRNQPRYGRDDPHLTRNAEAGDREAGCSHRRPAATLTGTNTRAVVRGPVLRMPLVTWNSDRGGVPSALARIALPMMRAGTQLHRDDGARVQPVRGERTRFHSSDAARDREHDRGGGRAEPKRHSAKHLIAALEDGVHSRCGVRSLAS